MEDMKKRKMEEAANGTEFSATQDHLRSLLDPLNKSQLVDLLSKLGSQYPNIAEEIKSIAGADPVHRKLFVRGLAWNTTSETLRAAFQVHGEIEEGSVIYDKTTGKSRGYGFITYKHMESTQNALRAPSKFIDTNLHNFFNMLNMQDPELKGVLMGVCTPSASYEMDVCITMPSMEEVYGADDFLVKIDSLCLDPEIVYLSGRLAVCNLAREGLTGASTTPDLVHRKLYIGGLSPEITSEMLLNFFGRHGEIEEGSVAYDKDTNESRGFGFITYKTVEAAKKAMDDPQKTLGGRTLTVKQADTQKGKTASPQLPGPVVPVAVPMASGKLHPGIAPVGYSYPQAMPSYPASYASPPAGPVPYQSQVPYPAPIGLKKEPTGVSPAPMGMGGYPYYPPRR